MLGRNGLSAIAVAALLTVQPPRRIFSDNFERADTSDGSLGADWDLRGPYVASYPLPASLYGRITGGRFVADANQVVYALKNMGRRVRKLTANISWVSNGGASALGTAAFIISPDNKLIDTALHITVNRAAAALQKRIAGGSFVTIANIPFAPSLSLGGVVHPVSIEVVGSATAVLSVSGRSVRVTDSDIPRLLGPYVGFEVFQNNASMVDLVRFEDVAVWA